jgi:ferredoxin
LTLIKTRRILSFAIFILFVLLFAGAEKMSAVLSGILPPLQFVPALLRTLTRPDVVFLAGLAFILLITMLFGRVYCSFLCPLGTLQDLLMAGSKRLGLRPAPSYAKPLNVLRYGLLALTAATALFGSLSLVILLDPYSLTGRMLTHFLQPLAAHAYNLFILVLKPFDLYLHPKQTTFIPLAVGAATGGFVLLVSVLAIRHGRLYCNTICPVGTLLGLLSRSSVFHFALHPKTCLACRRCESACKAACIDPQNAAVDMSRCVGCFNCLDACSSGVIRYQKRQRQPKTSRWSPSRRRLILAGIAAASGFWALNANLRECFSARDAGANPAVTPPGSISAQRFSQACTACSLCVSACPTRVLTPTLTAFGLSGPLQPKMNYEKSYCDYECDVCGRVCPTGAILPIGLEEKKLTQIGEAELLKDICVVYVDDRNCGACGEVCPTHAIRFTEKETILYPEIDRQYCIGCGACQLACPTTPRSIVVHARPEHKKAQKYIHPETSGESRTSSDQDFPF